MTCIIMSMTQNTSLVLRQSSESGAVVCQTIKTAEWVLRLNEEGRVPVSVPYLPGPVVGDIDTIMIKMYILRAAQPSILSRSVPHKPRVNLHARRPDAKKLFD